MKIAIIANSHFPVKTPFSGGLVAHTYKLTKLLENAGHEVTLFAPEGSDFTLPVETFCPPSLIQGEIASEDRYSQWEHYYYDLLLKLNKSNFDIIHNNSYAKTPLDMAYKLSCPVVTVLHCSPFNNMIKGFQEGRKGNTHHVIAVSNHIGNLWTAKLEYIVPKVIYNSVNTNLWIPPEKKALSNQQYAVWSGRITPEKGTDLAIKACIDAGVKLKICGPIHNKEYFNNVMFPLLNHHKENIEYLGCLNTKKLVEVVQNARVFVCTPCWEEAFGLVIAEALSCGVPIAGFNRGALPEILNENVSVLVEENVSLLAEAIINAQKLDPETCRNYALENFSDDKMLEGYVGFYNKILSSSV